MRKELAEKIYHTVALCLAAVLLFAAIPVTAAGSRNTYLMKPNNFMPIYRLYNPNTGEHFFTRSEEENDGLHLMGWKKEGIAWYAPAEAVSAVPVYRIYNTVSGEHYYTGDAGEVDAIYLNTQTVVSVAAGQGGYRIDGTGKILGILPGNDKDHNIVVPWRKEGIAWTTAEGLPGARPVYTLFNPNCPGDVPASHIFTADLKEEEALVRYGWISGGIAWFGTPDQSAYEKMRSEKPTATIETDGAYASIEAYVSLKDTRERSTGTMAKVVMADKAGAAASLGIQYEQDIDKAYSMFPEKTVILMENVYSNPLEPGNEGKHYLYFGEARLNRTYKLRLSWTRADNRLHAYVNDQEISYGFDPYTVTTFKPPFSFQVEASGAHDGDEVDATFADIKVKVGDGTEEYPLSCGTESTWISQNFFGLTAELLHPGTKGPSRFYQNDTMPIGYNALAHIYGTINMNTGVNGKYSKLGTPWDWDTCFSAVEPLTGTTGHPSSGVILINQQQTGHEGWVIK